MTRAEERALKAYPVLEVCSHANGPYDTFSKLDVNKERRNCYQQGYEQAEKDLGWHSVDEFLPPMDEEVIVLTDELNTTLIYKIAFGHIVDKEIAVDYNGWNIPGVSFWMPMPEIPNEK